MRLGRILPGKHDVIKECKYDARLFLGGAKGPGLFFVLPCVDSIMKVDLRTGE